AEEGRLGEAEALYRELLATRRRVLGGEHPDTLEGTNALGNVLAREGKLSEAEQLHREVLPAAARVFGEQHPKVAFVKYSLARDLALRGRRDEALSFLRDAVDHGLPTRTAVEIGREPALQQLHGDARFDTLVAEISGRQAH